MEYDDDFHLENVHISERKKKHPLKNSKLKEFSCSLSASGLQINHKKNHFPFLPVAFV
jgi:hypothetical protein